MFGVTGSIYFTVAICIERCFAICAPFFHHSRGIHWKIYVFGVSLITVVLNMAFFLVTTFVGTGKEYRSLMFTSLLAIPSMVLIVGNMFIVKALYENRRTFQGTTNTSHVPRVTTRPEDITAPEIPISTISRSVNDNSHPSRMDRQRQKNVELAIFSLIIDVVFIISHTLNALSFIYHILPIDWKPTSDLLVVLNSSINFYLFMFKKCIRSKI